MASRKQAVPVPLCIVGQIYVSTLSRACAMPALRTPNVIADKALNTVANENLRSLRTGTTSEPIVNATLCRRLPTSNKRQQADTTGDKPRRESDGQCD